MKATPASDSIYTELAIVGAGPAGLAAAEIALAHGIRVTLIDEQARPGGQIYRQPPEHFQVGNWLSNRIYNKVRQLVNSVTANDVDTTNHGATTHNTKENSANNSADTIKWLLQTTVLAVLPANTDAPQYRHLLMLNNIDGSFNLHANCVLIASGCYDMPAIFPGATLPGIMATGGIQAFVKSQQLLPGQQFLFVGSHPLQLIVADQIVSAGGEVSGIVFSQPLSSLFSVIKSAPALIRHMGKITYFLAALMRLLLKGVPIHFSRTVSRAYGDQQLQSVDIARIDRSATLTTTLATHDVQNIPCDRLGICFGFLASSELARQAGANCRWSPAGGGWIIEHDKRMCTSVPGLYVAGELTGIAGADVSMLEGKLAGLGIASELDKLDRATATALANKTRAQRQTAYQFAHVLRDLSWPGKTLLQQLMTDDSTLCKCEEVSVADFKHCLAAQPGITDTNAAKLLSRAGMGLCQGRYCNYPVVQLMADALGAEEQAANAFTARFPAKPVTIESLLKQKNASSSH